jgi:hypothetical protein
MYTDTSSPAYHLSLFSAPSPLPKLCHFSSFILATVALSGTVRSRLRVTLQGEWQYDWPDSLKKEEVLFWVCAPRNG